MKKHISASRCPFFGNIFVFVVAETIHSWTHDHGGRCYTIDPAGVVTGA
jgi:hypothetical protein